jgi:regulator of nonsense transcripts 1
LLSFSTAPSDSSTCINSQSLEIKIRNQQGQVVNIAGNTKKVNGRGVQVATTKSMASAASIVSVKTFGREKATNLESTRHQLLANVLRGTVTILTNPFVQAIFFPQDPKTQWSPSSRRLAPRSVVQPSRPLNVSQTKAVEAIISTEDRHRVVLIHGPPGTGKTTVIAASTQSIVQFDLNATVYLIAHSNVAVKNIAEKLVTSDFLDFKIIVSKEFHFDWWA